jgi:hypothetical protein
MRAFFLALWQFVYYKLTHVTEEKWRVLAICLVLSAGLWFLRQMNKSYTTTLKVRVSFEYDAKRYKPESNLPAALWLRVTAKGWPLAMAAYSPRRPRLIIHPALEKGYWMADKEKVSRYLSPTMPGVQIEGFRDEPTRIEFENVER